MKLHKVSGSIIGFTAGKVVRYIAPEIAGMDAATRKAWLFGAPGAARGSFTVSCLIEAPDEGPARVVTFAQPLTFEWSTISVAGAQGGKRRAIAVKQAELGLSTVGDPASLLDDVVFEVVEAHRMAWTPTYARNPATAEQAAKVRALVKIEPALPHEG